MEGFSRKEWRAVVARVQQAGYRFDEKWLCLLCGKRYGRSACAHTREENLSLIERVRTEVDSAATV